MDIKEIDGRLAEIRALDLEGLDAEAVKNLNQEVDSLNEKRTALIEERKQAEATILATATVEEKHENREAKPIMEEKVITRNSPEYINAYAEYIKTGDDTEVRALMTILEPNHNGTVVVPGMVEEKVRHAWERNEIFSRVPKTFLKGIYQVNYEASASGAEIHNEGDNAISAENLQLAPVSLTPFFIKKYVEVTDEVMSLRGADFLEYVYDELAYQIIKKASDVLVTTMAQNAGATETITAPALGDFINAVANLSDEAENPVIITTRSYYAAYKTLAINAYGFDPFDGMDVLFTSALSGNDVAIVADLSGCHINLPNGAEIQYSIDDKSIAMTAKDMVAILGKMYVALGVVNPAHIVFITK